MESKEEEAPEKGCRFFQGSPRPLWTPTPWAVCREQHVWESPEELDTKIMKDPALPRPPAVTFPEDR